MVTYDERFFGGHSDGALSSARRVVPILMDLVGPRSVVDVGCGTGEWLLAFAEQGVTEYLGVDGQHVPRSLLKIPPERFVGVDLAQTQTPLAPGRSFDLALSLEVGEHLPEDAAAGHVAQVCSMAPVVVFSAAVPLQGGTGHVNEQWPGYWAKLFEARGYEVVDGVRQRVWEDENVSWWYRQNLLVFVRRERLWSFPKLVEARQRTCESMLSVVHPKLLERRNRRPIRRSRVAHLLAVARAWVRGARGRE